MQLLLKIYFLLEVIETSHSILLSDYLTSVWKKGKVNVGFRSLNNPPWLMEEKLLKIK